MSATANLLHIETQEIRRAFIIYLAVLRQTNFSFVPNTYVDEATKFDFNK